MGKGLNGKGSKTACLQAFMLCVGLCMAGFSPVCAARAESVPAGAGAEGTPEPGAVEAAMGFEADGVWFTAPMDVLGGFKSTELTCSRPMVGPGLDVKAVPLAELAGGLTLGTALVQEGKRAGVWKDLEKVPTIMCRTVWRDWTAAQALEMSVFSEQDTGDIITVGILADNPKTAWRDYYVHDFTVDWTGWKRLVLPLSRMRSLGTPTGLDQVEGLYFFSKAFYRQPNPYTVLHLDAIALSTTASAAITPASDVATPDAFVYQVQVPPLGTRLNHDFPEVEGGVAPNTPYTHQYYFQAERALFKYYPAFHPGYVSFDPSGKAYVNAGETIQWIGDDGQWKTSDIKSVLVAWAKARRWQGLLFKWGADSQEQAIRFDADGDAYLLEQITALTAQGSELDSRMRRVVLLHSSDGMRSWSVYELPKGHMGSFEKQDGHNPDCIKRPPAILVTHLGHFPWPDPGAYLIPPARKDNGRLVIPAPVRLFDDALTGSSHSGDANSMVTSGDDIFIVAGWCPGQKPISERALASRPPLPAGHPGLFQTFKRKTHGIVEMASSNGVPTFVMRYNVSTGNMSEPVYIGSGGGQLDGHNTPGITMDGDGILHVLIDGHHDPANYVHSLAPRDISAWTDPAYILAGTELPNVTYATLNCDSSNTLHAVFRSTRDVYNNHLGYYRKRQGEPWEPERTLVSPFKGMYYVWGQKMTLDPGRDRLFLTYFSLGNMMQLSRDQYEFLAFQLPDREETLCENYGKSAAPWNPGPTPPGGSWPMYRPGPSELTILVSDDRGETWRLALTPDFRLK